MNVNMEIKEAGRRKVLCNRYRLALAGLGLLSFTLLIALIVVASVGSDEPMAVQESEVVCEGDSCIAFANMLKQNMDTTVDPCVDFYDYVCTGYFDQPLNANENYKTVLTDIGVGNEKIIEAALSANRIDGEGEATAKAKDVYQACMNIDAIEAAGVQPLEEILAELDLAYGAAPNVTTAEQLARFLGKITRLYQVNPFFAPFVSPKSSNPDVTQLYFFPPFLTLPARDFYLDKDPATDKSLLALREYIARITRGISPATSSNDAEDLATRIVALETRIAEALPPVEVLINTTATNNPMTLEELASTVPEIDWDVFFDAWLEDNPEGLKAIKADGVNVQYPPSLRRNVQLIVDIDSDEVVDLLRWMIVHNFIPESNAFQVIRLDFDKVITGVQATSERSKQCYAKVLEDMPSIVGKLFSDKSFSEDSRLVAEEMVEYIKDTLKTRIDALSWMDAETKEKAKEKADMITTKVGYPTDLSTDKQLADFYKTFETGTSYVRNSEQAVKFGGRENRLTLGKPVDRTKFLNSPAAINAYYSPPLNDIAILAGVLQQPVFDESYPSIMNFGGIGYIIGHEFLHAFDNKGNTYDGTGRLVDWWTSTSKQQFNERSQCLVDQYDEFPVGDMTVNGLFTLTENIADNGGLAVAYEAYKRYEKEKGLTKQRLPGFKGTFSGDQLFFMSAANIWCTNVRPEKAESLLRTDTHSPGRYRVNGAMANMPSFSEAFKCPAGSPMNSANKCTLF